MAKEITIVLNDQERSLKFKRLSLLKYAEEYSNGKDPLELINATTPSSTYEKVRAFTIAGIRCAGDETTSVQQLDEWIEDMSFEDAAKVVLTATEAILGGNGVKGEEQPREMANQLA